MRPLMTIPRLIKGRRKLVFFALIANVVLKVKAFAYNPGVASVPSALWRPMRADHLLCLLVWRLQLLPTLAVLGILGLAGLDRL